jgi:hypothetical protein
MITWPYRSTVALKIVLSPMIGNLVISIGFCKISLSSLYKSILHVNWEMVSLIENKIEVIGMLSSLCLKYTYKKIRISHFLIFIRKIKQIHWINFQKLSIGRNMAYAGIYLPQFCPGNLAL